jgi:hypothetical protein
MSSFLITAFVLKAPLSKGPGASTMTRHSTTFEIERPVPADYPAPDKVTGEPEQ